MVQREAGGKKETRTVLFFELSQLGLQFVKVGIGLAFCMCQGFLNHQKLVELVRNVKVSLFHLDQGHPR